MKNQSIKYLTTLTMAITLGALAIVVIPEIQADAQTSRGSAAMQGDKMKPDGAAKMAMKDERQLLTLSDQERIFVLAEMRGFLESVQAIVEGVAEAKMDDVAAAAHKSGMAAIKHAPKTLMKKLPPEFRMLGGDTHKKFDALATEARQMGNKGQVLKQLSALLTNCTSCHATYRFGQK